MTRDIEEASAVEFKDVGGMQVIAGEVYVTGSGTIVHTKEVRKEGVLVDTPYQKGVQYAPLVIREWRRVPNPKELANSFRQKAQFIEGIITEAR